MIIAIEIIIVRDNFDDDPSLTRTIVLHSIVQANGKQRLTKGSDSERKGKRISKLPFN